MIELFDKTISNKSFLTLLKTRQSFKKIENFRPSRYIFLFHRDSNIQLFIQSIEIRASKKFKEIFQ